MKDNLDIFVFANNDFKIWPDNPAYKLVIDKDFETEIPWEKIICDVEKDPILKMEHGYSEGARLHYIWKNVPLKDYIGTAHYRRYFEFYDKIPNMDEIFKEHDAILPIFKLGWPSIYENYRQAHNVKDIDLVLKVIHDYFPSFYDTAVKTVNSNDFIPCNIFVLKKETFYEWCNFVFGVLDKYNEAMGFRTDLDIVNYVVNRLPEYCERKEKPNGTTYYQTRIQAFLLERLSTIFFHNKIKNPLKMDLLLTEVHDDFEPLWFKIYGKDGHKDLRV